MRHTVTAVPPLLWEVSVSVCTGVPSVRGGVGPQCRGAEPALGVTAGPRQPRPQRVCRGLGHTCGSLHDALSARSLLWARGIFLPFLCWDWTRSFGLLDAVWMRARGRWLRQTRGLRGGSWLSRLPQEAAA